MAANVIQIYNESNNGSWNGKTSGAYSGMQQWQLCMAKTE